MDQRGSRKLRPRAEARAQRFSSSSGAAFARRKAAECGATSVPSTKCRASPRCLPTLRHFDLEFY